MCVWLCRGTVSGGLVEVEGHLAAESAVLGPGPVKRWLRVGVGRSECSIVSMGVWVSMNELGRAYPTSVESLIHSLH